MGNVVIVNKPEDVAYAGCNDVFANIPGMPTGSRRDMEFNHGRFTGRPPSLSELAPHHFSEGFAVLQHRDQQIVVDFVVHLESFEVQLPPDCVRNRLVGINRPGAKLA
jgi:hypothetical protein